MENNKKMNIEEMNNISFNFINDKDLAKLCFYTIDEKFIYENNYNINNIIGSALKDLIKRDNEKNYLYSFYTKNNENNLCIINEKKPISFYITNLQDTLFLIMDHNIGVGNISGITTSESLNKYLKIYVKKYNNLNIPENIEEHIITNTELIGKPAINQLKYYVYDKNTKILKLNNLSKEQINIINGNNNNRKIQNKPINYFSRKTTYCNAENILFIYEGNKFVDNNKDCQNDCYNSNFFNINLRNNEINLISNKFPQRFLHSMIFIPDNYIFILGGKNALEMLVYIIQKETQDYYIYPHFLPFQLFEPSLITIDNKYLYAFENSGLFFHILRTNFLTISPFEEIQLKNDLSPINQKFFGVVKQKNNILFLGGQMINSENFFSKYEFEFDINLEKLKKRKKNFEPLDFCEKTLIPLGNKEYIQIVEELKINDYLPIISLLPGNLNKSEKTNSSQQFFNSIHTKNINIHVNDNMTSLVGSSSFGEMGFGLYNNK